VQLSSTVIFIVLNVSHFSLERWERQRTESDQNDFTWRKSSILSRQFKVEATLVAVAQDWHQKKTLVQLIGAERWREIRRPGVRFMPQCLRPAQGRGRARGLGGYSVCLSVKNSAVCWYPASVCRG